MMEIRMNLLGCWSFSNRSRIAIVRTKHLNKVFVMARVRKMIQKFFSPPSLSQVSFAGGMAMWA